ncbi:MAG: sigma-54-dependent Fis family transcriptional regulator [Planctomycetes bacterium]|nr:sigma-54-dependent Fis family transcriptional regulator [Planctomycetota bacterium]
MPLSEALRSAGAQGRDSVAALAKLVREAFVAADALDALRAEMRRADVKALPAGVTGKYDIVGVSAPMAKVYDLVEKVMPSSYPVLIQGESGTGKELIARALHKYGPRKDKPFVSENCAAIPETLLESELFGHKRGAFTGADKDRKGHFETANTGTIFLDEIGDMSPGMQTKLLRVLQDGEVRPVGGDRVIHVDVRVIAASNKDLRELVGKRMFREDLYFRLNVITIYLPPLRERKEDIPLLVAYFLQKALVETKREIAFTAASMKALQKHRWPGNVRELENEVRRGVALCDDVVDAIDLSPEVRGA